MSKFKVGDRVIVNGEHKGTVKVELSAKVKGYVGVETDESIYPHDLAGKCKPNHGFWASPCNIAHIKPTTYPTIIIHTDGITTTALMKQGKLVVKQAHAVCSPSDTYDHEYGVRLALDRLFEHEVKATPPAPKKPRIVKQERYSVGDKVKIVPYDEKIHSSCKKEIYGNALTISRLNPCSVCGYHYGFVGVDGIVLTTKCIEGKVIE